MHADGTAVGGARPSGGVRLLRQQAAHHRRGRHGHARPPRSTRSASTPSATRAARRTWAGSTTTGSASTTASPTSPARSASRSSSGSTTCSPPARAWRPRYREALAGLVAEHGLTLPCEDAGGDVRGWFVFVVQLPRRRRPRRDHPRAARARRAVQAVPAGDPPDVLLPRAVRPPRGRVPGREAVAARSLALPFHPGLRDDQVERVADALAAVLTAA